MSPLGGVGDVMLERARARTPADAWRQFQSLFLKDLVRELRQSSAGEEGMFGSGPESGVMEDWYDQYLSEHLAAASRFRLDQGMQKQLPATLKNPTVEKP